MLNRKLLACVVFLFPATALTCLTLTAQDESRQAQTWKLLAPATAGPNPNNPFGNRAVLARTGYKGTAAFAHGPVTEAFQALKAADSDEARANAKTDLRKALVTDYDDKMDQYDAHIESLEKELEQMKDRLSRRRAAKEEMVDLKLKEMLANADGLGWPGNTPRNDFFQSGLNPVQTSWSPANFPQLRRPAVPITPQPTVSTTRRANQR